MFKRIYSLGSDGVFILIFCYGFLFFGFKWLDFGFRLIGLWIPMGFGLDSDWLIWVDVVVWWWRGGDCGGSCLVVVGHCGGFVWSSLVLVGLFLLGSSLLTVLVWFKIILIMAKWFVVARKLDGGGWMRHCKRKRD